jgi:molecular chaperone Hsp33
VVPAPSSQPDELVRTLSRDGAVGVRAIVGTALVREAVRRHRTAPTATAALGRTLLAAILLAAEGDDDETVQLQLSGSGPLRSTTAIADAAGRVRGCVGLPTTHLPPREDGKLDVGGAIGAGILTVVRFHPSWREPYSGIVPLVSGEVAEDVASYLRSSEQKPCAVALGVHVDDAGTVDAAGGYLVQALPNASEASLATLEANVLALPPPSELVRSGLSAGAIADRLLAGLGRGEIQRVSPSFHCGCDRERVLRAVALLGRDEMRDIARKGDEIEVRCAFCAERYAIAADEVGSLALDA